MGSVAMDGRFGVGWREISSQQQHYLMQKTPSHLSHHTAGHRQLTLLTMCMLGSVIGMVAGLRDRGTSKDPSQPEGAMCLEGAHHTNWQGALPRFSFM